MPHDEFEQYLAGLRPLAPEPLPRPVPWTRWLVPVGLAAALALVITLAPKGRGADPAPEAPFTLGRANALVVGARPWKAALDEAAFSGQPLTRGSLEFLTQEELRQ